MKNKFKSLILIVLCLGIVILPTAISPVYCNFETDVTHKASVLIDKNSKEILYENNANERLPIASVTKLMTILLTLEQVEQGKLNLKDTITVSENASGMGGSQIFLDANLEYEVGELLKSVIVASANDSSVALAEHIAGSESNFVRLMNERASELGLKNTHYSNCTGLPTPDGVSSALDQALVLSEVLKYDDYHTYSSIWLEDFSHPDGRTTQMTNTNKLSRFYSGCIGGKTGSTNQAKFCLAVGARRGDTELISVVLGADNSKERFNLASNLLNYGFDNFVSTKIFSQQDLNNVKINIKGKNRTAELKAEKEFSITHLKNEQPVYSLNYNLPNMLTSVEENQVVGNVEIIIDGVVKERINILSKETVNELSVWDYIKDIASM